MTVEAYLNPDFGWGERLIFFSVALAGCLICVLLIIGGAALATSSVGRNARKAAFYKRSHNFVQRFYEMIISGSSVMFFSCSYVILNHIYTLAQEGAGGAGIDTFVGIWESWKDFILLLLICLSCVLNTLLDRFIIPLKRIDKSEKASIRLLAMFYVILILIYLNFIGDESEYSPVMMYYLGLMVGRFVYFDASFSDFLEAIINAFKNLPLLILGMTLMGLLTNFGFKAGYLLERNYYIVGIFYTHVFMLTAIFIIHLSHILNLFIKKPAGYAEDDGAQEDDPGEYARDDADEYGDYEEYDDEEDYYGDGYEEYEEDGDWEELK
ncbi:MAG: hypothetical protein J6O71_05530 [Lachnospiraceae bacterium]|nr:hypothetical protein [Lachnospiraceae bacterium]